MEPGIGRDSQPVALADLRKQACIAAIAFDVRIVAEAAGVEPETRTEAEAVAPQVNRCNGLHLDRVQASGRGTRSAVGLMRAAALAADPDAPSTGECSSETEQPRPAA